MKSELEVTRELAASLMVISTEKREQNSKFRALLIEARGVLSNCIEDLSAQPNADSGTIAEAKALQRKLLARDDRFNGLGARASRELLANNPELMVHSNGEECVDNELCQRTHHSIPNPEYRATRTEPEERGGWNYCACEWEVERKDFKAVCDAHKQWRDNANDQETVAIKSLCDELATALKALLPIAGKGLNEESSDPFIIAAKAALARVRP